MALRCEFPRGCTAVPTWWVAGAHANDWAVHTCDEHRQWARDVLAPWIEEPVRHPAPQPPNAVRST